MERLKYFTSESTERYMITFYWQYHNTLSKLLKNEYGVNDCKDRGFLNIFKGCSYWIRNNGNDDYDAGDGFVVVIL